MDPKLDPDGEMSCEHQRYGFCKDCLEEVAVMARRTVLRHILEVFVCIFNFEFYGVIVESGWAFQRLFRVGDYGPHGWFSELKIKWWEPNE
jgi:hypothetical protein